MKRKPEKNYKLPKYAAGLAAMLFAGGMTGCTDPAGDVQLDGDMDVPEDTACVQLAGDAAFVTEDTTEDTTEEEFTEVMLAGDVVMEPEETCPLSESLAAGVAEFTFPDTEPAPPKPELEIAGDIAVNEIPASDIPPAVPGLFITETE